MLLTSEKYNHGKRKRQLRRKKGGGRKQLIDPENMKAREGESSLVQSSKELKKRRRKKERGCKQLFSMTYNIYILKHILTSCSKDHNMNINTTSSV